MAKQPEGANPERKPDDKSQERRPDEQVEGVQDALHVSDEKDAGVWEDEPGLGQRPSEPSSVIEVAEIVEEPSDARDVHEVFAEEPGQGPRSSSIIEVAELAEVVEGSDQEHFDVKPAPATPPPNIENEFVVSEASSADQATEEIDWDDIGALGDSKVSKKSAEDDQTIAFETGPDSAAAKQAAEDELAPKIKKKAADEDDVSFDDVESMEEKSAEEAGARALLGDEEETGAKSAEAEELAASAFLDDEETGLAFKEAGAEEALVSEKEEERLAKKKKGKKRIDEEEELVGAGAGQDAGKPVAKPVGRPKYARHMAGGMVLATLLLGGAAAGVWYFKPDLLEDAFKASPNYALPKKEKAKVDSVVRARAMMDNKDYDQALTILKDAAETPVNLATRAEARWLKYLQAQTAAKKPLDKDAPEVKSALADLKEAGNDLLAIQITKTLDDTGSDKSLQDLKERAEKAEAASKKAEENVSGVAEALVKEKYLDDKDKLDPAVFQKVLKDLAENKTGLAAVNKLLEDAKIKDSGDKGVAKLVAAKKDADEKLAAVDKLVADEKFKDVQEMIAGRAKLAKDRDELDQAVKGAYKELADSGLVPPSDDPRAKIVAAVKIARQRAESPLAISLGQLASSMSGLGTGTGKLFAKSFDLAAMSTELAFYRLREPLLPSPDWKLDTYMSLLQSGSRQDPVQLKRAAQEAAWILSEDAKSSPEARAKAYYVIGLANRDLGNFDPARKNLSEALKAGSALKDAPWRKVAANSLKELSEPAAYFFPRAEKLATAGDLKGAQEVLNLGLKAMPNNPRLLALRALVRIESAHGDRNVIVAAERDIRRDAEAAARDAGAAADAAYALGALDERLGNFDQAEVEYRKAVRAHLGDPDTAGRYIIALARLLQRDRTFGAAPALEPKNDVNKNGAQPKKAADPRKVDDARLQTLRALATVAVVGVQFGDDDEEDPATAARVQESIGLANKLIQSANPKIKGQGYMILGRALSKKGRRTEGMREYVKGLQLLLPGAPSRDMSRLLEEHPAFQQAEAPAPNPALAEQFFTKGLDMFWSRRYAAAEAQFKQAVQYYNQDARFQYYLGMSLLNQAGSSKRDAAVFAFEQGARLEAANRPSMGEINASLERIQGPLRAYVNSYRKKAAPAAY